MQVKDKKILQTIEADDNDEAERVSYYAIIILNKLFKRTQTNKA